MHQEPYKCGSWAIQELREEWKWGSGPTMVRLSQHHRGRMSGSVNWLHWSVALLMKTTKTATMKKPFSRREWRSCGAEKGFKRHELVFCEASYNGKHTSTNKLKIFVTNQLTHVSIFKSVYVYSYEIDPNFCSGPHYLGNQIQIAWKDQRCPILSRKSIVHNFKWCSHKKGFW